MPIQTWTMLGMDGLPVGGDSLVRLIYLDESGTSNLKDSPYVVVAGVIVDADRIYRAIEIDMLELIRRYVPRDAVNEFHCFHAKELFNGSGKIFKGWPIEKTLPIINGIIRSIIRHNVPVVYGVTPRAHYQTNPRPPWLATDKDAAHVSAFVQALMRANAWMRRRANPGELAMVIAEDNPDIRQHLHKVQMTFRSPSIEMIQEARGGLPLNRIIESVLFQKKGESFILPLADMCCYVLNRKLCGRRIDGLFDWLSPQVMRGITFDPDALDEALKTVPRFRWAWNAPWWGAPA